MLASVKMKTHIFGLDFHPTEELVAIGLITGAVHTFDYSSGARFRRKLRVKAHKGSCRATRFAPSGAELYTCGTDAALHAIDVASGVVSWSMPKAHPASINALIPLRERGIVTGDDDGMVRVWDVRQQAAVMEFHEQEDFISDMWYAQEKHDALLVTSGDGTFAWFDLRKQQLGALSDSLDDELLCVALVKGGRKVVAGSQGGVLNMFSYGNFGDVSDRHPGHPGSIDSLAVVDEETIVTGSSDGYIRMVTMQPWRLAHVVGDHEGCPVERVRVNAERTVLASVGHDCSLRLWDLTRRRSAAAADGLAGAAGGLAAGAAGGGDSDDEGDEEADSDDDDEAEKRKKRKKRSAKQEMLVPAQQPGRVVRLDSAFTAGL
jgi:WD40 repeat protein